MKRTYEEQLQRLLAEVAQSRAEFGPRTVPSAEEGMARARGRLAAKRERERQQRLQPLLDRAEGRRLVLRAKAEQRALGM